MALYEDPQEIGYLVGGARNPLSAVTISWWRHKAILHESLLNCRLNQYVRLSLGRYRDWHPSFHSEVEVRECVPSFSYDMDTYQCRSYDDFDYLQRLVDAWDEHATSDAIAYGWCCDSHLL